MNVLDLYRESSLSPQHVSGTHGGEWAGPCPKCGGNDRFRLWPEQNSGDGSFWCRGCAKGGDAITYLIEYRGMRYPDAVRYLGKELPDRPVAPLPKPPKTKQADEFCPEVKDGDPADLWQKNAAALSAWATERLMQNNRPLSWLKQRGIRQDTARRFCLGWNPGKDGNDLFRPRENWGLDTELKDNGQKKRLWIPRGLVIPLMRGDQVRRIRIRRPSEDPPRYYVIPGSEMDMMVLRPGSRAVVVVESELDAILLDQEAGEIAGVVALGSSSAKPDPAAFDALKRAVVILNALDSDKAGAKASVWWEQHFPDSERWPVPVGKDPGDAYQQGVDLYEWVRAGLPAGWNVGPSGKFLKNEKKAESKEEKPKEESLQEEKEKEPASDVPAAVAELAEILRKHPVSIRVTPQRLSLRESMAWSSKHWETARRLSELVFANDEVFDYLYANGDEVIDGKNILTRRVV